MKWKSLVSRRREGLDLFSTPEHKTRILPLRWFVNWLNGPATECLNRALNMDEANQHGWKFKMYLLGWKYLNAPYERWGTVYKIDMEAWKDNLKGAWEDD